MGLGKKTIDDENYAGKRVLVRCDFNVPMKDGVITNDNRINAALPTIKKLINDGAKVILCSHLGKPKNGPEAKFSLAPVAVRLSEKLGQPVVFAVINTIPAPVLPRTLLQRLPAGALIIDLASLPGGTDFAAAEELGLHAEHALALPGRCAPQTAGALIAQTVLAILEEREEQKERSEP